MHIFFSGIGGTAISALALIAKQAGYEVSGSDARPSEYLEYLKERDIADTYVGLNRQKIAEIHDRKPIDWYVQSSAQLMDFPGNEEYKFVKEMGIKDSKRDELINKIIKDLGLQMIAVAGTHGKSTVTAMLIYLAKELGLPAGWSAGAKMSFADTGHLPEGAQYFIYEADEFDRNFLAFHPAVSLVTGIDWDHPDIYPTREDYNDAFRQFLAQSQKTVIWKTGADQLGLKMTDHQTVIDENDSAIEGIQLKGLVNRQNAWQAATAIELVTGRSLSELVGVLNAFPGLSRRFEEIAPSLYSDYAHTPGKIRGALQTAQEVAGRPPVVIYEGLHNLRQHFIKGELVNLFNDVKQLYIVPTYLGREDPKQKTLSPAELVNMLSNSAKGRAAVAKLDDGLKNKIGHHLAEGDLVLCLTAGGVGSLDEWLRQEFRE